MTEPPARAGKLWLPVLGPQVRDDRSWAYQPDPRSRMGFARLRVWEAVAGGFFAVVTETGAGLSVTSAAVHIRARLRAEYGEPFGLAELHPEGAAGPARLDLVPPVREGERPQWIRLWPTGLGGTVPGWAPDIARAWWSVHALEIIAP